MLSTWHDITGFTNINNEQVKKKEKGTVEICLNNECKSW